MDIVRKKWWFFLFSAAVILPGIIALAIPPALKPGIEFTSGAALTVTFKEAATDAQIRDQLTSLGITGAVVQKLGDRSFFIRTGTLKDEELNAGGSVKTPSQRAQLEAALSSNISPIESKSFDSVSPVIAGETVRNAAIAVAAAAIVILLYITWAFRRVPKPFRYGVCAVIALVHDLLVVVGIFSILGKVMNMEVNSMFIVGVLTVMGYSVHDTIVVFDRIRENILRNPDRALETTVNLSLFETMGRSLNTTLTTLITLGALLLIGGPTIRPFLLVMFIGFVTGAYSSIFTAAQVLVAWEKGEFRRALRVLRLPRRPNPAQSA